MNSRSPETGATAGVGEQSMLVISGYADARAILVSSAARVPQDVPPARSAAISAAGDVVDRGVHLRSLWMWGCDTDRRAPCHKVAAMALGPGAVEALGPYLETRAGALLDAGAKTPEFDLVGGFARPLVRDALMTLFGVAESARASLDLQVGAMAGFIPGNSSSGTARYFALAAVAKAVEDIWAKPLPSPAAASRVLRDAVDAGELSRDEALAQATLLLFGNSYTTLDALTGLIVRFVAQPDLWQAARIGSIPVAALVEESLRLGPPTHLVLRRDAAEAIDYSGGVIPAGTRIVVPLDRVNRDPACFADPDSFEPGRTGPPHLAFGAGRNMCIGLHLARAVIRISVETLLPRITQWPGDTRIDHTPGILGGSSVNRIVVPAEAMTRC